MSVAIARPAKSKTQASRYPTGRVTVAEYHRMIDDGELTEMDPVELIEERIVEKMPHGPEHDGGLDYANEVLRRLLSNAWRIRIQSAITTEDSEPEPDLAVVRNTPKVYLTRHPS